MTRSWLFSSRLVFAFIFAVSMVQAEYNVSTQDLTKLKHITSPIYFTRHNQLYIIGGNSQYLYQTEGISLSINGEIIINYTPANVSTPPIIPGDIVKLAVYSEEDDIFYLFTGNNGADGTVLAVLRYSFDSQMWQRAPLFFDAGYGSSYFRIRGDSTATLGTDGAIYLYGGFVIDLNNATYEYRHVSRDMYKYNPSNGSLVSFLPTSNDPLPYLERHTGTRLSDGSILYLGGLDRSKNASAFDNGTYFYNTSYSHESLLAAYRFFPESGNIERVSLRAADGHPHTSVPSWRLHANAILSMDKNKIYFFGGFGQMPNVEDGFLVPFNELWELDVRSWTWNLPELKGGPPLARTGPASALLTNNLNESESYLVYVHGGTENAALADINVLSLDKSEWLRNITLGPVPETKKNSVAYFFSIPGQAIAIFTVACVVGVFLLIFLVFHIREWIDEIFLWDLRRPNPTPIEIFHIICKLLFTGAVIAYAYYVIHEVANSATVSEESLPDVDGTVNIPDIRFCFDGWKVPLVRFQTDTLDMQNCSDLGFIQKLDMSLHEPYFASGTGFVECFLFSPAPWFQLQKNIPGHSMDPQVAGNGSYIKFEFYGHYQYENWEGDMLSGLVQISLYPLDQDPNINVYNISNDQVVAASNKNASVQQTELTDWIANEKYDLQRENTYYTQPGVLSMAHYTLQHVKELDKHPWNYVGAWSKYTESNKTKIEYKDGIPTEQFLQLSVTTTFTLFPENFGIAEVKEQRVHTLITGIGSILGLIGFLITQLDTFLFGRKPVSPWGIVQRSSFVTPKMKQKMAGYFMKPDDKVPFVEPVKAPRDEMERGNFGKGKLRGMSSKEEVKDIEAQSLPSVDIGPTLLPSYSNTTHPTAYQHEPFMQKITALEATVVMMQERMQYTELVMKTHYIDPVVFDALYDGGRGHNMKNEYDTGFFARFKETRLIWKSRISRKQKAEGLLADKCTIEPGLKDQSAVRLSTSDDTIQTLPVHTSNEPDMPSSPGTVCSPESSSPSGLRQSLLSTRDPHQLPVDPSDELHMPLATDDGHNVYGSQEQDQSYFPSSSPRPTHRLG